MSEPEPRYQTPLRPCPFCGKNPSSRVLGKTRLEIACVNSSCRLKPAIYGDWENYEAIRAWNYRPLETESDSPLLSK